MPADRPGSPEPLPRLADLLGRVSSGVRPTPLELAELLWLAGHMEPAPVEPAPSGPKDDGATGPAAGDPPPPVPAPRPETVRNPRGRPGRGPVGDPPEARPDSSDASRTPLRLPSPAPAPGTSAAEPHSSLLAPAPPMLRHTLALQRSLRPLKRRTDAPVGHEVDEAATA
ncbi:hypothetical protein ACFTXB_14260 [Streptomyces sp. NPDC057074]|uniref:hypothetical protein n=1 Tax=Streptomyces sp. NPDC057074 TaxID=3346015 RepID=UPI003639C7BC